ncbi:unnamed protein product [Cylindrotheca closterium]|uniref:Uncharacterized protein n=1 Tax=Cylindrotheca closterium TaxID=2856 RepID=A0AAD2FGW2_9STRA|nr:unnamed protein product [Cylindrotheca closterium]
MPKDNIIKRRSSCSKVTHQPGASLLRRRKSASAVLEPTSSTRRKTEDKKDQNPLVLGRGSVNVSAGRTIYERASSRRERHRLALKNGLKLGEEDGSNHIVALGRVGARGPNRSSLTKESPEGEDPGLLAIAAADSKRKQAGRKRVASTKPRGYNSLGRAAAASASPSQRNQSIFNAKMKAASQKSKRIPVREKLLNG